MKLSNHPRKLCVFGSGTFGFVLARHLGKQFQHRPGSAVHLYGRNTQLIQQIRETRCHPVHFPMVQLPQNVHPTSDLEQALQQVDLLVLAVPAQSVRAAVHAISGVLQPPFVLLNTAKGLELATHLRLTQVIREAMPFSPSEYAIAVLSGGTIASEMILDAALGAEIACDDVAVARTLQHWFSNQYLRIYANQDVTGVEYAGALKNVIAIGAGISDGLRYPYGTKTLLISRACAEAKRLALQLGGMQHTFSAESQAWSNDLWMSCVGNTRNRYLGELIGEGLSVDEAQQRLTKEHKIAEGYPTTQVVHELIVRHQVEAPVLDTVHSILYEGKHPQQATVELMTRQLKVLE